jgi:hypothetical protein
MIDMEIKTDTGEVIHVKLDADLLNRVRKKGIKVYGPKSGYLTKAVNEGMSEWANK